MSDLIKFIDFVNIPVKDWTGQVDVAKKTRVYVLFKNYTCFSLVRKTNLLSL